MSEFIVAGMRTSVDVDGVTRTFTVVGEPGPRDLVLIFHGSRQTGDVHRRFTGGAFDALATEGRAVVTYLDGYRGNWNDARRESAFPARQRGMDDVGFARAVVARLAETHGIAPGRVFALGYSNGGQLVLRLLHEAPEVLAGAAVFAATMPARDSFLFPDAPPAPRPVLLIHGTRDPIVPFGGGAMRPWAQRFFKVGGSSLSATETAAYLAARNGIAAPPASTEVSTPRGGTWIERTDFAQDGAPPVRLFTVHGGGHTIPGPRRAPFVLGRTGSGISAATETAEFLGIGRR